MSEPSTPLINTGSFSQHSSPNKKNVQQKLLLLKLKRINELNNRLKDSLSKERIYASNASYFIIDYTQSHKDYAIPEVWGNLQPGENPFRNNRFQQKSGASGAQDQGGCCTIM